MLLNTFKFPTKNKFWNSLYLNFSTSISQIVDKMKSAAQSCRQCVIGKTSIFVRNN